MIAKVELTKDQEEELNARAVAELKEIMSREFICKTIQDEWTVHTLLKMIKDVLYTKVYSGLKEKELCQLSESESIALSIFQLVRHY